MPLDVAETQADVDAQAPEIRRYLTEHNRGRP